MARGRAQLTEKQERIMVQSQLMGLTTADMIRIANRMKALEAEREFIRDVDEVSAGKTWEKKSYLHYVITDEGGRVYDCQGSRDYNGWQMRIKWNVNVTHPKTRMKPKSYKDQSIWDDPREVARVCPGGEKHVYRLMKQIHSKRWS